MSIGAHDVSIPFIRALRNPSDLDALGKAFALSIASSLRVSGRKFRKRAAIILKDGCLACDDRITFC